MGAHDAATNHSIVEHPLLFTFAFGGWFEFLAQSALYQILGALGILDLYHRTRMIICHMVGLVAKGFLN